MNLRVELLLEAERRSASVVSGKFIARITMIAVPAVLALFVAWLAVDFVSVKARRNSAEALWKETEPKLKKAKEAADQLQAAQAILTEVDGWMQARLAWHEQLRNLQKEVPGEIQLTTLTIGHTTQMSDDRDPSLARVYTMNLDGNVVQQNGESLVEGLRAKLVEGEYFSNYIAKADAAFKGETEGSAANKKLLTFQITSSFKQRKFK